MVELYCDITAIIRYNILTGNKYYYFAGYLPIQPQGMNRKMNDSRNLFISDQRPHLGELVHSTFRTIEAGCPALEDILAFSPRAQFSRAIALVALKDESGQFDPRCLAIDDDAMRYKEFTGWTRADRRGHEYRELLMEYGKFLCHQLQDYLTDDAYHEPGFTAALSILVEHTRRYAPLTDQPFEDDYLPLFAGTNDLSSNIVPSKFGPHIDFTHSSPSIIGFAVSHDSVGTILCQGEFSFVDPTSSKEELNKAGNALVKTGATPLKIYYGDSRTLLHEGPEIPHNTWRNFVRFFVGPAHPRYV